MHDKDFVGGIVGKNPPDSAGDMGGISGPGRSHMPRSNKASAPQLLSLSPTAPVPQQEMPLQWEAWTRQLESALEQQQRPSTAKEKKKNQVESGWAHWVTAKSSVFTSQLLHRYMQQKTQT